MTELGRRSVSDPIDPALIHRLIQLSDLSTPRWVQVVADLGVADALGEKPEDAETLARKVGANPDALRRVLFLLCGIEIFQYDDGRFSHSPLSLLLRSDHAQSQLSVIRITSAVQPSGMPQLGEVLRTGRPYSDGSGGAFAFLANNPEIAKLFDESMTSKAQSDISGILEAYDFGGFTSIADIGGSRGHLIRAVLDSSPKARGVLFDLPHVIEPLRKAPKARLTLQAGDFFKDRLPESDAYLLMNVIHDWDDEQAIAILRHLRAVAPADARVLLFETLMPEQPGLTLAVYLDVTMLATTGGRERTEAQYEALLAAAGLELSRVIPTRSGMSILEAAIG